MLNHNIAASRASQYQSNCGSCDFLVKRSKESCEVKQLLAKERKTRSSIHEPFVCFDLIHRSLNWSLAPRKSEPRSNSIIIPLNPSDKAPKLFDTTFTCLLHPSVESLWLTRSQHLQKRLEQTIQSLVPPESSREDGSDLVVLLGSDPLLAWRGATEALLANLQMSLLHCVRVWVGEPCQTIPCEDVPQNCVQRFLLHDSLVPEVRQTADAHWNSHP